MLVERGDQRLELGEQLVAAGHRERANDADAGQLPGVAVQAEQERADRLLAGLVCPVAGHHAVGRPLVLDLEHDPPVRLVGAGQRLSDDPVQAGSLELLEPSLSQGVVGGRRRHVEGRGHAGQRLFQRRPALLERPLGVVVVAEGEQVERDEVGRRLAREHVHPAGRRVDPLQQGLEVEPAAVGSRDHDLPIDHAPARELLGDRGHEFGEVAGHRPLIAAAELHLAAVGEDDGAESVPLRLVAVRAVGKLLDRLGQHRRDGRVNRKVHPSIFHVGHPVVTCWSEDHA
jgi:hypothetical protein